MVEAGKPAPAGLRLILAVLVAITAFAQAPAVAQEVPTSRAEIALSFAPVVKKAAPAVVNVHMADVDNERSAFRGDPFLERFFGRQRRRRGSALGSGVIVDASGLVVTNAHVVGSARELRVSFNDQREYNASLLLKDERTDLAVLRIDAEGPFPTISFGNSDDIEVGDIALAIGNPFGVGQTVTQGIVSAVARTQVGVSDYRFFIQTDAAINPGNSGGALISMSGKLVGINTAIYSRSGGSNGIGFAIPTEMVSLVVQSAQAGGAVVRPWLGARLQTMTRDLARQYKLDRPTGALVVSVMRDSPASRAGVRVGDIVVGIEGVDVRDNDTFGFLFATKGVSGTTTLTVLRGGKRRDFDVALESPPETVARDARRIAGRSPFAGAIALNLSPKVADELNLDLSATGVALARVDPRSSAQRVGFKVGDIVLEVNGLDIVDTRTLERASQERQPYWDIIIERGGEQLSLVLGG